MRLFFIIDNNEPHSSGGGYYAIFKFAEFLARRGHEIFIYAVNDLGWVVPNERLQLHYRPSLPRKRSITRPLDRWLERFCDTQRLPRLARAFQPDWVLGVLKESAIKAVAVGRALDRPVANFIYECPPWLREIYGEEIYNRAASDPYTRALWEATRNAYLSSDLLLPNSELAGRYAEAWLNSGNIATPAFPGVDPEQMPAVDGAETSSERSALFVGRLVEDKNVHHLIDAWRRLPRDITLNIVGSGPLRAALQQRAADLPNVIFHGYVADEELWRLYRRATLLVCPTRFEGFGMPPMQALYFEKPCLASDIPILRSLYGDHIDYFPMGDVEALAADVLRIVNDPDYARAKGAAGRAYVLRRFTWSSAAETIEQELSRKKGGADA